MDTARDAEPEGPAPTDYWRGEVLRGIETVGFIPPAPDRHRRMSTEQAGITAYRLLASPEGTSPAEVMRATGRSRRWATEWLSGAVSDGRGERTGHGSYRLREPEAAGHGS